MITIKTLARNNGASADMYLQHDAGNLLLCGNEGGAVGIGYNFKCIFFASW
ncbi:MAG: hypothetical protein IPO48_07005 [Saprospiraceae bacterium]|nr:hypothetical protein [Saprospiraceae bacterium]